MGEGSVPSQDRFSSCTSCIFLGCFLISKHKQANIIRNHCHLGLTSFSAEDGHTGATSLPSRENT